MIADLHAHYPMHVIPPADSSVIKLITTTRGRAALLDRIRAGLVRIASLVANYEAPDGAAVTAQKLHAGGVGVALSVLYSPFDEMDIALKYGSPPLDRYPHTLIRQLREVEDEVASHSKLIAIARNPDQLDAILDSDRTALVHCVEGGFHLGSSKETIDRTVTELAGRGVAYITLAHLFYRGIAANAPAIPFLPDRIYERLFPEPKTGLTELGVAAIKAMVRERVLIDISHMNTVAVDDTFKLLDRLDPDRDVPVIASHVAYRFGSQEYNLDEPTVRRIAARDGVIGLILSEHQANEKDAPGHRRTRTLADSLALVFTQLERLAEITGSTGNLAIGSDHDGFIKPTLAGLSQSDQLDELERALIHHFGAADAEAIASGNVMRLLHSYWRGGSDGA